MSRCDHHDGRRCTLGRFGGLPSLGTCQAACDRYDGSAARLTISASPRPRSRHPVFGLSRGCCRCGAGKGPALAFGWLDEPFGSTEGFVVRVRERRRRG
jgi:hypothetical protein